MPTRTSRTGGIRSFAQQVIVSVDGGATWSKVEAAGVSPYAYLTFTPDNWYKPQKVMVRAIDDSRVDGQDAQVFAPQLEQLTEIQGPLYIIGGEGRNRSALYERDPMMLPYERNVKPGWAHVVSATDATTGLPATVTIRKADLLVHLGVRPLDKFYDFAALKPSDLVNISIEITEGLGKNKIRIITSATEVGSDESGPLWKLTLSTGWFTPFISPSGDTIALPGYTEKTAVPSSESTYCLVWTNPNFLVNELEMVDRLTVYDRDNVNSWNDPALPAGSVNQNAVGKLTYETRDIFGSQDENSKRSLNMYRLTGLGMAGDRVIGQGKRAQLHPGGITFVDIDQTIINLGSGNNWFTIDIPQSAVGTSSAGLIELNTGGGNDIVDVLSIAGHTVVNGGAGNDTVTVSGSDATLARTRGLLTVSGDTPRVIVETVAKGSPASVVNPVPAVNEKQRVTVDGSAGQFTLAIAKITSGVRSFAKTALMQWNISGSDMRRALQAAAVQLFGVSANDADPSTWDVVVEKAGQVYLITFQDELGGRDIELLEANDLLLKSGSDTRDVMVINDSGAKSDSTSVLTSSTLTGLDFQQVNEVQQVVVDATQGTFTLTFRGATTIPLAYNISAAAMQAALRALSTIGEGNVAVSRADDVYVIRFEGSLNNTDVPQIIATSIDLQKSIETSAGVWTTYVPSVTPSTRTQGIGLPELNDMQVMTVNAASGRYKLTFGLTGGATYTTDWIRYDASADEVQDALQKALALALSGGSDDEFWRRYQLFDVAVQRYGSVYLIGFQGMLRQVNKGFGVRLVAAAATELDGGTISVIDRMDGINYYGFEQVEITLGTGTDILNIQGTTAGSNGFSAKGGIAVTNVRMNDGEDKRSQVYISSDADLDFASIVGFDFLTGNLDDVNGALNLDFGNGQHKLMISDEAATVGDADVRIVEGLSAEELASHGLATNCDIAVLGLSGDRVKFPAGGISYKGQSFQDGVVYWTGSGDDTVTINATHRSSGGRTVTMLNTGLGNDHVLVDLDLAFRQYMDDDFFVLNTSGGAMSPKPGAIGDGKDDDVVLAGDSTLPLLIFAGWGSDTIVGGSADDMIFGDFGRVWYQYAPKDDVSAPPGSPVAVYGFGGRGDVISNLRVDPKLAFSVDRSIGGADVIFSGLGADMVVGGVGDDVIDGAAGTDLIFGDNALLDRVARYENYTSLRYQEAARLYYGLSSTGSLEATGAKGATATALPGVAQDFRLHQGTTAPWWADWKITLLDHAKGTSSSCFGSDYIAGGPDEDVIFGELGDDIIQGDGDVVKQLEQWLKSLDATTLRRVTASRKGGVVEVDTATASGYLDIVRSFDATTDGDDYIEGGGGDDVIFGGLGQDDIIGGSSSLYGLTTADMRPDGTDTIFGGSGTNIERSEAVTASTDCIDFSKRHARDADVIVGDNGVIYRITKGTGFAEFKYDARNDVGTDGKATLSRGTERVIPRAVELLDYTPGGPDSLISTAKPLATRDSCGDNGAGDEIHGEAGDDVIYGMTGNDVLFGDGEDDDIIGGWGNDWISGGAGQDGILGDDGRIYTSRNTVDGEPLYGIAPLKSADKDDPRVMQGDVIDEKIATPGSMQTATLNPANQLKKSVDLIPFNVEGSVASVQDKLYVAVYANDIIFGGLGSDFIHGGSGDDAISGAEAVPGVTAQGEPDTSTIPSFWWPFNPGDILDFRHPDAGYIPGLKDGKLGEFALYDEYNARRLIPNFFLNFDPSEGTTTASSPTKPNDGDDVIFGDLGNDWIVGGTGRDDLYGGYGDDLLNADDDLTTDPENKSPDTNIGYEDRAYGGAGRDILIANTGGDRLIDWVGEFNSYIVPFAPFGAATVSRTLQPGLMNFLYELSLSDGADQTRAAETGSSLTRHGEPEGELGLVLQKDADWKSQTGAPADPQPGNIPGGRRDVLRSASFNGGTADGFAPDSGNWAVVNGRFEVSAKNTSGDAVSVFYVDAYLPYYYEVKATINAAKPLGGYKANAYLVFDYLSPTDFKFAGIDVSLNKMVMGHRDATGWKIDAQKPALLKPETDYRLLLAVNGTYVTLLVNEQKIFTYTYAVRVDEDGFKHYCNEGMVGLGVNGAKGRIDDVSVQILPPTISYEASSGFATEPTNVLAPPTTGAWQIQQGRYVAAPSAPQPAIVLAKAIVGPAYQVLSEVTVNTQGEAGFVFDCYSADDFKFALVSPATGRILIGHYTKRTGWVVDLAIVRPLLAGTDYRLGIRLTGNIVEVTLGGTLVASYAYNALITDGRFGLLARTAASFDDFVAKTDDPSPQILK